jgi:hypothetical protein
MLHNNQQHMITILYLSFDKLMEQSHKKLVQHMVLMQAGFSTPQMLYLKSKLPALDDCQLAASAVSCWIQQW